MRLLLDTHALAWWWIEDKRLPSAARVAIADPDNTVVSAITGPSNKPIPTAAVTPISVPTVKMVSSNIESPDVAEFT
jgi:hypothetical protein